MALADPEIPEVAAGEEEDTGAQIAPIIRLEAVAVTTGEEEEDTLLDLKAKLYRFDKEGNQWKERGAGTVKLLKHKVSEKVRLVMRQSKTLKICANHLVLPSISIQEHAGNEKSCVWHATDFSDGELKKELFCIRFASIEKLPECYTWDEEEGKYISIEASCSEMRFVDDILYGNLEMKYKTLSELLIKSKGRDFINIWERGAKVVGVLHGDKATVILQRIRGNLGCIYPRKLILVSLVNALVQRRYKDTLLIMVRRYLIDFNVIIDHCSWEVFFHSAAEFVRQINNLSYITEFICSIKNENVMETLYKNIETVPSQKDTKEILAGDLTSFDGKGKISCVLLAVRKALEEQILESPPRELCILNTLARSEPPALEEALKRVKVIHEMEIFVADNPRRKFYPSADEALKHLL
ncbi:hypothetical protein GIB67_017460 [Kingdonia uniflora]|uniref:RanBD1 domain-containing protein n=1 Tax=Kingdonia uniflora TaxID=39325 RepID=A0A7J7M4C2_9MAGN|nr:hypothetical protein GIB67_017460 [Kingdonia uniflora]